jgi:hypothetical protein
MKSFNKIITVFLAGIFLMSTLGLSVNKMICLESGREKISLTPLKDCCPDMGDKQESVAGHCCDIQNSYFHLNDFSPSAKSEVSHPGVISLIASFNPLPAKVFRPDVQSYADLPPPLHGRDLLTHISVLVI